MISVVIPTLNAETTLGPCLAALIPAALDGVVSQVIIADGGSTDHTSKIADNAGADFLIGEKGRGSQIAAGAKTARCPWLLVLHADTVLEERWEEEASNFMAKVDLGEKKLSAAAFCFRLDDSGLMPRMIDMFVNLRSQVAKLPYGDQGLLIPRRLYDEIGGFRPMPLMEDVDIVRRLGVQRISMLKSRAFTSAKRYTQDGYLKRIARNQACFAMYMAGIAPSRIASFYQAKASSGRALEAEIETHGTGSARNIKSS